MVGIEGKYCLVDSTIEEVEGFNALAGDIKNQVYEVIRIIDGVPLFMEDHYRRLESSFRALDLELEFTQEYVLGQVDKLIKLNGESNCNVKIIVYADNLTQRIISFINKSYYPDFDTVRRGVPAGLIRLERERPNAKVINAEYRQKVTRQIEESGVFEVLLVNGDGKITEGSRSNVFFAKGEKIFTAPATHVLKGITRKYIFDACKAVGIEVIEELVDVNSLEDMEGLFISGTSIKVLPVSNVDGKAFESGTHPVITAIRDEFDRLLDRYIQKHRK